MTTVALPIRDGVSIATGSVVQSLAQVESEAQATHAEMSEAALSVGGATPLSASDRAFLNRTKELARQGWGQVHPNPMVGALIAKDGHILAEACHETFGGPHAEILALERLPDGLATRGTTLYSSLEPCTHQGKTPPCTHAILKAGISRVVYGAADLGPNSGGGGDWLRAHGVTVRGPLGERSEWAAEDPFFFHSPATPRPYVAIKLAVSRDGKIAPPRGKGVRLTGDTAREEVFRLRAGFGAVMVGTRTWKADDPRLTARGAVVPRISPVPVLLDRRAEIPVDARALNRGSGSQKSSGPPFVVTSVNEKVRLQDRLGDRARVLGVAERAGRLDLVALMFALKQKSVSSVLCEGGGVLASSLLAAGLVDRFYLFVAPQTIGSDGVPAFPHRAGTSRPSLSHPLSHLGHRWRVSLPPTTFGNDTLTVLDREL